MKQLEKVVLVEDDADIREIATLALETVGGLAVHSCDNGRVAVDLVEQVRPDIVVLDCMMPGFDGTQTLEALRARPATAGVPVVFMTAKLREDEVARLLKLGGIAVIPKPFDPMTLAEKLRGIWDGFVQGTTSK